MAFRWIAAGKKCVSQSFTCLTGYRRQARGRQESAATRFLKSKDHKGPAIPHHPTRRFLCGSLLSGTTAQRKILKDTLWLRTAQLFFCETARQGDTWDIWDTPWDTPWDTYGTTHYYYVVTRGDAWDTLGTLMGQLGAKKGVFWKKIKNPRSL